MSDPVSDFVNVTITVDSVGPSQVGFGTLAILTHDAPWSDRSRSYRSTADAATDGFVAGHPVYRALTRALGQNPKPTGVKVIRTTAPVQMEYTLGVNSVLNDQAYAVSAKGQVMADATPSYTSDDTATNDEIVTGLVAALNAVTGREFTAEVITGSPNVLQVVADAALTINATTFTVDSSTDEVHAVAHGLLTGDGPVQLTNSGGALPAGLSLVTDYWIIKVDADNFKLATSRANARATTPWVDITGTGTGTQTYTGNSARRLAPNKWFSLALDPGLLSLVQAQAAPAGLSTDLDAIVLADNDWFGVVTPYGGSAAYVLAVDAWVSANSRIYFADSADSSTETHVLSGATDALAQLAAVQSANTAGVYHRDPSTMLGAGALGRWLSTLPGKSVPNLKAVAGALPVPLSGTGWANVKARYASSYITVRGLNVFTGGAGVPVGSRTYLWIDVTRNLLWLVSIVQTGVFGDLAGAEVIGYDQAGIQRVEGKVRGILEAQGVPSGVLAGGTQKPVVTAPNVADVSEDDKAHRVLNNVAFSGTVLGAIGSVDVIGSVVF